MVGSEKGMEKSEEEVVVKKKGGNRAPVDLQCLSSKSTQEKQRQTQKERKEGDR